MWKSENEDLRYVTMCFTMFHNSMIWYDYDMIPLMMIIIIINDDG